MDNNEELKKAVNEIPSLNKSVKSLLKTITDAFSVDQPEGEPEAKKEAEVTEEAFVDVKLTDGSILRYDSDQPGTPVFVVTEGGELLPAPDGRHEAEDGTIIVTEGGMLQEIVMPEEEPEVEPEFDNKAPETGDLAKKEAKKIIESIVKESVFSKEEVEAIINEKFEAVEAENKELKEKLSSIEEFNEDHFAITKKLASEPSVESKVEKKDGFKAKAPVDRAAELDEWRNKYGNI